MRPNFIRVGDAVYCKMATPAVRTLEHGKVPIKNILDYADWMRSDRAHLTARRLEFSDLTKILKNTPGATSQDYPLLHMERFQPIMDINHIPLPNVSWLSRCSREQITYALAFATSLDTFLSKNSLDELFRVVFAADSAYECTMEVFENLTDAKNAVNDALLEHSLFVLLGQISLLCETPESLMLELATAFDANVYRWAFSIIRAFISIDSDKSFMTFNDESDDDEVVEKEKEG